jgi:hypothetical protein
MDEVREMEKRATVEDLMYAAVLEKFLSLGVNMLGNMDNILEKVRRLASLPIAAGCLCLSCCQRAHTAHRAHCAAMPSCCRTR